MVSYLFCRFVYTLFALWGALTVIFVVVRLVPGDPALLMIGPAGTRQDVAALRHRMGLDRPVAEQYVEYVLAAARLDFGQSLRLEEPTSQAVLQRLPATVQLALSATVLAVLLSVPLGMLAALRHRSLVDHGVSFVSLLGQSVPNFWLGIMLILVFARDLRLLPSAGIGGISHLVLPSVTLAVLLVGVLTRLVRSGLLEVVHEDYVRSAYAKGLATSSVLVRHALPNALIPVVTVVGLQLGQLLAGAVIVETVFAWPGVGRLLVDAITTRDYPVVQVVVLVITAAFSLVNLAVDVSYALLDPRIRYV